MKKLTVRIDGRWLEAAKLYATRNGTSLSQLIGAFIHGLTEESEGKDAGAPTLRRLTGILPADATLQSYGEHLSAKYDGIR